MSRADSCVLAFRAVGANGRIGALKLSGMQNAANGSAGLSSLSLSRRILQSAATL